MKTEKIERASKLLEELKDLNAITAYGKHITPSSTLHFRAFEHYGDGEIRKINKRHTKRIMAVIEEIRDEVKAEIKNL